MKIVLISEQQLLQNMLHIALERRNDVEIVGEYLEGKAALKALAEMESTNGIPTAQSLPECVA